MYSYNLWCSLTASHTIIHFHFFSLMEIICLIFFVLFLPLAGSRVAAAKDMGYDFFNDRLKEFHTSGFFVHFFLGSNKTSLQEKLAALLPLLTLDM